MRRLFAVVLSALLVFGFAPVAKADVAGLTPCSESARFQQRAAAATTPQAKARFEMYSQASCGEDGLPHLIVDGRWSHAGDFVYPGIMFLYVAGCIGWAGREYLKATRGKNAAQYEILLIAASPSRAFWLLPPGLWLLSVNSPAASCSKTTAR